jgi:hypothetical protein
MIKNEKLFCITTMDPHTITIILPYLRSDVDRVHLLQTCREFAALIPHTVYTDKHIYTNIKHLPYIKNFQHIEFNFIGHQRTVELVQELSGVVGTIPNCVTHLYYDSDIPINTIIGNAQNIRKIRFAPHFDEPIAGLLPPSVKKIWVGHRFRQPFPTGCEVKVYPIDPWGVDDGW